MIFSKVKKHKRYLFWQMFLPAVLLASMLLWITAVIYGGKFDSQPALRGQFKLIERALSSNRNRSVYGDPNVVVVSIDDADVKSMGNIQDLKSGLFDLSIKSYAKVIASILQQRPNFLMIRWIPAFHQSRHESYEDLIAVFKKYNVKNQDVYLAIPQNGFFVLPEGVKNSVKVIDDDLCTSIGQICVYESSWDDWAPQISVSYVEANFPNTKLDKWRYTNSLNTTYPSYILNLIAPDRLQTYSVQNLFKKRPFLQSKMVFLGRDLHKKLGPEFADNSISHMVTVHNIDNPTVYGKVTPLHVFWAQMSEMVLSQKVPYIPTLGVQAIGILIFVLLLGFLVFYLSLEVSIFAFIIFVLAVFNINYLTLKYFNLYMPVLNIIYFSLVGFIFFNFLRVLYTSYLLISEKVNSEQYTRADHIQTNFMSLLSHNLITPVARMQSSVNQIKSQKSVQDVAKLTSVQKKLLTLEFCLKAMLLRMSLAKYQSLSSASTLNALHKLFIDKHAFKLAKQSVNFDIEVDLDEELTHLPLKLDAHLWSSYWFYLILVLQRVYQPDNISISWEVAEGSPEVSASYSIKSSVYLMKDDELLRIDLPKLLALLNLDQQADDFFIKLYCNTLSEVVGALDSLVYLPSDNQLSIELRLSNR